MYWVMIDCQTLERIGVSKMTIMRKGTSKAKILETATNTIIMFEFQTRFFGTWQAAVRFLMSNGYSF